MKRLIILFIFFIIFLVSCSNNEQEKKNENIPEKTPLVVINDKPFYIDDLLIYAHFILNEMDDKSLDNEVVKKKILQDFIRHQLLTQKAIEENIKIDKEKIDKVIKNFNSFYGKGDLELFTSQSVLDLEHLKKMIEQQMMIQSYLDNKISSKIIITKDELKDFYKIKIKDFPKTKLIHLYHIITNNKKDADKARRELYKRKPFKEVAQKYSIGPAKDKGGDLGYIDVKNFPEVFQKTLKMRKNTVSKVIKSEYGYHIFKVVDIKVNKIPSFEELSGELYAELFAKKQDNMTNELIEELVKNANIKVMGDFSLNLSATEHTSTNN
jgi:parvulin-like peptidyl-prolyl isomerase